MWSNAANENMFISSETMRNPMRMFDMVLERQKVIILLVESQKKIHVIIWPHVTLEELLWLLFQKYESSVFKCTINHAPTRCNSTIPYVCLRSVQKAVVYMTPTYQSGFLTPNFDFLRSNGASYEDIRYSFVSVFESHKNISLSIKVTLGQHLLTSV